MPQRVQNTTIRFIAERNVRVVPIMRRFLSLLVIICAFLSAGGLSAADREFRGAWVATVHNIDWPSKPGLPASTQQAQLVAILERARELKLNAILLQVRPMS